MVALNKTYQKTLTRLLPAKDSGRRFYSPEISRWLSRDPALQRDVSHEVYLFVRNAPSQTMDALGLEAVCEPERPFLDRVRVRVNERACDLAFGLLLAATTEASVSCIRSEALRVASFVSEHFPDYDPHSNGYNVHHCVVNCLIAKNCGLVEDDRATVLAVNAVYEACTMVEVHCVGYCGRDDLYLQDVLSDLAADMRGFSGGVAGGDCASVCRPEESSAGPQSPPACEDCEIAECRERYD
jgi:RHS repeat-associated protein